MSEIVGIIGNNEEMSGSFGQCGLSGTAANASFLPVFSAYPIAAFMMKS
jgi:hypothetical protein